MSFNLDDPLAGILSDGSDDSFFDDDILGKKKPIKKSVTPIGDKKNALFNLDADDIISSEKQSSLQNLGPEVKKVNDIFKAPSPALPKRTESKEKVNLTKSSKIGFASEKLDLDKSPTKTKPLSSEKIDILGALKPETTVLKKEVQKPLVKGKSSQSLLDDILGGPSLKSSSRPTTATARQEFDLDNLLGKSETKFPKPTSVTQVDKPKPENKTPKKVSKSNDDWLGLFKDKDEEETPVDDNMPAWLAGGDNKKKVDIEKKTRKSEAVEKTVPKSNENKSVPTSNENEENSEVKQEEPARKEITITPFQPEITLPVTKEDVTAEGAALYLQQQESQLMVALQLKAQEEKLAAMQVRQKESQRVHREAALAQQVQLDSMLKRQIEQRQQMQAVIGAHQERITQRIKALLETSSVEEPFVSNVHYDAAGDATAETRENPYSKEKLQLLQLVQSLQENHDKEIDLMETSYRRQLAFQEVSLTQVEERMKEDSEKLVKFYSEKTNWLEEHHLLFKRRAENNMIALIEQHKAENDMLRQQHLENIRTLQEHHASLMENVKNAVKQEQTLIKDSVGFSTELTELVAHVKDSKTQCQILLDKVQMLTESSQQSNDRSVSIRETQITDMIEQLKKERECFETEKSESREIIKILETRLKQMTLMVEDETASLKQKKMELEFEKATFNKQTEFAKNVLKRQDDEIKMIRDEIQKEYQERIAKMDEDKGKIIKDSAIIAKEKSSIQNIKQELDKMKAELQAQLEEVTEERSKLSVEKQQLHLEEQRIIAKSRDLDLLAKTAIDKQSQADKKYSEAEFLQRKYEERIRRIQEHVVSLNSREKLIAREKVALSRERLNIHNDRKQMERNQCSYCKSREPYHYDSSVPELFTVSRDHQNANITSAMGAIEQEMANLMGRSFNLRHHIGTVDSGVDKDLAHIFKSGPVQNLDSAAVQESGTYKEYLDPKFMMLRLEVQRVLNNVETNKDDENNDEQINGGDKDENDLK